MPGSICSIDPGITGAVAFYSVRDELLDVRDMPAVGKEVDAATLAAMMVEMQPRVAIVERVGVRPGEGAGRSFNFGQGFGVIKGVIAASGVPMHLVSPAKWKKAMSLDTDKEKSRALALRMWPMKSDLFRRVKDHGRAEAAILAHYAHLQGF